jgi:endonuclease/exonuclease/phosphatase family metal-dependent hydrolase
MDFFSDAMDKIPFLKFNVRFYFLCIPKRGGRTIEKCYPDKRGIKGGGSPGMDQVLTWPREYRILSVEEDPMRQDNTRTTIMTMNLRFGLAQDGENGWQHRKSLVAKLLEKYRSDFLGFQEVNHFQADFLTRTLSGYKVRGQHNKTIDGWQSNLIFFHRSWNCLEQKHYFLSDTPEVTSKLTGSKWPRQCVIGVFQRENDQIIVANTHFDFDPLVQEKSAGLVINFLAEFPLGLPVILVGDFNANPGSLAHILFKTQGFGMVFDPVSGPVFNQGITPTFHGFEGRDTGKQIDWILYKGVLKPVFQQVVTDSFANRFPSDHYPVRAGFVQLNFSPGEGFDR